MLILPLCENPNKLIVLRVFSSRNLAEKVQCKKESTVAWPRLLEANAIIPQKTSFFLEKIQKKKIVSQWARGRGKTSQWANHQRCLFFHQTRDERAHTTIQNKKSANFFESKKKSKIFAKSRTFFRE